MIVERPLIKFVDWKYSITHVHNSSTLLFPALRQIVLDNVNMVITRKEPHYISGWSEIPEIKICGIFPAQK